MSKSRHDFEQLRYVRLGQWTVRTYDLNYNDRHGKPAIGYRITEHPACNGHTDVIGQPGQRIFCGGKCPDKRPIVVAECYDHAGAVYCGSGTCVDSDAAVASVIQLVCHCAQHDSDDMPITPSWDAEGLAEECSMRWGDL